MGNPIHRGLPPTHDGPDDGSALAPQGSKFLNIGMPIFIIVVAILAVGGGFYYVTPKTAISAVREPEGTTLFDGLDRLRELGVVSDHDSAPKQASGEPRLITNPWQPRSASSRGGPTTSRPIANENLVARMADVQTQLAEAKRRLGALAQEREALRLPAAPTTARAVPLATKASMSRAQNESVRRSYGPLTRPGMFAFAADQDHSTPRPVSYNALRREGIATDYSKFVQAMTGSGLYRKNDRRPFHHIPTTEHERSQMDQLFAEINDLAPVWVQMGILKP